MRRASYHHGDLREALVVAAEKLVAARGIAGFSLREAARAVGVDPAACYRHFRDKDAILQELAQRGFGRLAAAMEAALAGKRTPRARVAALGKAYIGFAIEHPPWFRAMFGPTGFDARDPRLRGQYAAGRGPYQILEDGVRELLGTGASRARIDTAALILWSGAHGYASLVIDGAIRPSRAERERRVAVLLDTMIDALG
jgi:AcrR family transcriptional regulator